jgi:hypothetical protein
MRPEIQEILDKIGVLDKIGGDFFGEDITDRLASDWEFAGDQLACLEPAVSCEEYIEITAFLAAKAEKQLVAAQSFSRHVADLQAMDQRWLKWIEAARAAGKSDFSLGAWRDEVRGTPKQNEAFAA